MTDEKLTMLLRRALLDHGYEGENALRILRKTCDPHRVRIVQEKH